MEIKRMLELIIDAAKNDDMNRIIELAENQQDKFCDNNCVWTDHHKDCVRAEQKPVVEVRLVAGGKPMFLMCVLPESFKDGDSLYTTPQQPIIDKSAAIRIATALGWTPPKQEPVREGLALKVAMGEANDKRLEAQKQEPSYWTRKRFGEDREFCEKPFTTDWEPLYTSPPPRQPLTDEQWQVVADTLYCIITRGQKDIIEAALGITGEQK